MQLKNQHLQWMEQALILAEKAGRQGEVPVGAILVKNGINVASSGNAVLKQCDPTAHAEILVLREACMQSRDCHLHNTTLYTTLEPCLMCLGAIMNAQVGRVVFGAYDPKRGASGSALDILQLPGTDWRPDIFGGVLSDKSCQLLRSFFQQQRRRIPMN